MTPTSSAASRRARRSRRRHDRHIAGPLLHPDDDAPALIDAASGRALTHAQLADEVAARAKQLAGDRDLVLVRAGIDLHTVVHYLAALEAGHAVLLLDAGLDGELLAGLLDRYRPGFMAGPGPSIERLAAPDDPPPHPDLLVLLSTSGTTGSPKLVRLSAANVEANASSIAEYLEIGPGERAIASLPFHYSYGLSVLNSHLRAGATVVLPAEGLLRAAFWRAFEEHGCTSFAGVPYSYELLRRTGWDRHALPTLRTMTQAGGRLAPERVRLFASKLHARGARLVVMYGATEATARMSYVPPERLLDKLGSIGIPIPRGRLSVEDGELIYEGPNVMLGYAESREDLALGDVQHGRLPTGDLGHADEDGYFFVTGRLKRFTKVYGLRVNLDEVERAARAAGPVAAIGADENAIVIFVEEHSSADPAALRRALAARFQLSPKTFDVRRLERLPTTAAGKIDYAALPSD